MRIGGVITLALLLLVPSSSSTDTKGWRGIVPLRSTRADVEAGDEYLRCPGYDGISYSSDIPRELRPRLLERLNQFVRYSFAGEFEKQYELYLPEFAAKMFAAKNKKE